MTEPVSPVGTHAALPPSAYAGTYTNTTYGTAIVSEQNGNLTVTIGPAQQQLLLVQGNGNTFLVAGTQGPATFDVDNNNNVKSMTLTLGRATPVFARN